MEKERNEDGQYVETIELGTVRKTVQEADHVVTTQDVADSLDISREAARQKLVKLHEDDQIEREDNVVWWMESPWPSSPPAKETPPDRKVRRRQAGSRVVPALVEHLREHGPTRETDLKEIAWQTGGDVYIEDKDTLWEACKGELVTVSEVDPGGMGPWKFTGKA